MKPPKCRTCGKEEWNHTCKGPVQVAVAPRKAPAAKPVKPEAKRVKKAPKRSDPPAAN